MTTKTDNRVGIVPIKREVLAELLGLDGGTIEAIEFKRDHFGEIHLLVRRPDFAPVQEGNLIPEYQLLSTVFECTHECDFDGWDPEGPSQHRKTNLEVRA